MLYNPLPIIITVSGAYMLVKLRFFFIRHPIASIRAMRRGIKGKGAMSSLCLALAGTLGVGNVLGVCVGLSVGGAGAVFWMLASSVFAAALKYSEVYLASTHRTRDVDGTMTAVIAGSWGRCGRGLSLLYSFAILLLSLIMGAALQSNAVAGVFGEIFDTPPCLVGIFLVILTLAAVIGGVRIIERVTLFVIPVTTTVYIILTASVIIVNLDSLPRVLGDIWHGAFSLKGAAGGIVGFLTGGAVKEGFCRGILSNEAGAGTSTIAHGRRDCDSPMTLGLMGIVEVVFDTVVLCTLTALAVLTALPDLTVAGGGISLIMNAISSSLGDGCCFLLLGAVLAFAYSTVICWYYYGIEACRAVFGGRVCRLFLPVYISFVFIGAMCGASLLVSLTDVLMLSLCTLCCLTVIKSSDRIADLSEL